MEEEHVTRLERRMSHLERSVAAQGAQMVRNADAIASMKETSQERLEYIKDRFDEQKRTDEKILARLEKRNQFGRWITNLAVGILFALAAAVNNAYLEPMTESITGIERRLLALEARPNQDTTEQPK
jgi:hypothetical protein